MWSAVSPRGDHSALLSMATDATWMPDDTFRPDEPSPMAHAHAATHSQRRGARSTVPGRLAHNATLDSLGGPGLESLTHLSASVHPTSVSVAPALHISHLSDSHSHSHSGLSAPLDGDLSEELSSLAMVSQQLSPALPPHRSGPVGRGSYGHSHARAAPLTYAAGAGLDSDADWSLASDPASLTSLSQHSSSAASGSAAAAATPAERASASRTAFFRAGLERSAAARAANKRVTPLTAAELIDKKLRIQQIEQRISKLQRSHAAKKAAVAASVAEVQRGYEKFRAHNESIVAQAGAVLAKMEEAHLRVQRESAAAAEQALSRPDALAPASVVAAAAAYPPTNVGPNPQTALRSLCSTDFPLERGDGVRMDAPLAAAAVAMIAASPTRNGAAPLSASASVVAALSDTPLPAPPRVLGHLAARALHALDSGHPLEPAEHALLMSSAAHERRRMERKRAELEQQQREQQEQGHAVASVASPSARGVPSQSSPEQQRAWVDSHVFHSSPSRAHAHTFPAPEIPAPAQSDQPMGEQQAASSSFLVLQAEKKRLQHFISRHSEAWSKRAVEAAVQRVVAADTALDSEARARGKGRMRFLQEHAASLALLERRAALRTLREQEAQEARERAEARRRVAQVFELVESDQMWSSDMGAQALDALRRIGEAPLHTQDGGRMGAAAALAGETATRGGEGEGHTSFTDPLFDPEEYLAKQRGQPFRPSGAGTSAAAMAGREQPQHGFGWHDDLWEEKEWSHRSDSSIDPSLYSSGSASGAGTHRRPPSRPPSRPDTFRRGQAAPGGREVGAAAGAGVIADEEDDYDDGEMRVGTAEQIRRAQSGGATGGSKEALALQRRIERRRAHAAAVDASAAAAQAAHRARLAQDRRALLEAEELEQAQWHSEREARIRAEEEEEHRAILAHTEEREHLRSARKLDRSIAGANPDASPLRGGEAQESGNNSHRPLAAEPQGSKPLSGPAAPRTSPQDGAVSVTTAGPSPSPSPNPLARLQRPQSMFTTTEIASQAGAPPFSGELVPTPKSRHNPNPARARTGVEQTVAAASAGRSVSTDAAADAAATTLFTASVNRAVAAQHAERMQQHREHSPPRESLRRPDPDSDRKHVSYDRSRSRSPVSRGLALHLDRSGENSRRPSVQRASEGATVAAAAAAPSSSPSQQQHHFLSPVSVAGPSLPRMPPGGLPRLSSASAADSPLSDELDDPDDEEQDVLASRLSRRQGQGEVASVPASRSSHHQHQQQRQRHPASSGAHQAPTLIAPVSVSVTGPAVPPLPTGGLPHLSPQGDLSPSGLLSPHSDGDGEEHFSALVSARSNASSARGASVANAWKKHFELQRAAADADADADGDAAVPPTALTPTPTAADKKSGATVTAHSSQHIEMTSLTSSNASSGAQQQRSPKVQLATRRPSVVAAPPHPAASPNASASMSSLGESSLHLGTSASTGRDVAPTSLSLGLGLSSMSLEESALHSLAGAPRRGSGSGSAQRAGVKARGEAALAVELAALRRDEKRPASGRVSPAAAAAAVQASARPIAHPESAPPSHRAASPQLRSISPTPGSLQAQDEQTWSATASLQSSSRRPHLSQPSTARSAGGADVPEEQGMSPPLPPRLRSKVPTPSAAASAAATAPSRPAAVARARGAAKVPSFDEDSDEEDEDEDEAELVIPAARTRSGALSAGATVAAFVADSDEEEGGFEFPSPLQHRHAAAAHSQPARPSAKDDESGEFPSFSGATLSSQQYRVGSPAGAAGVSSFGPAATAAVAAPIGGSNSAAAVAGPTGTVGAFQLSRLPASVRSAQAAPSQPAFSHRAAAADSHRDEFADLFASATDLGAVSVQNSRRPSAAVKHPAAADSQAGAIPQQTATTATAATPPLSASGVTATAAAPTSLHLRIPSSSASTAQGGDGGSRAPLSVRSSSMDFDESNEGGDLDNFHVTPGGFYDSKGAPTNAFF